jgi:hypothetical protein
MTAVPLNLRMIETIGTRDDDRKQRPIIPSTADAAGAKATRLPGTQSLHSAVEYTNFEY